MTSRFAGIQPEAFRKKRNLWLAYASELGAPLLRMAANMRSRGEQSAPTRWRRGLILGHTHIGDVLYRTCSLPALREHLPNCEWTYVTSDASAEILKGNPHVAETLPLIKGEDSWNLDDGALEELRSHKFDVVLCTNTLRHYPDLALAVAAGIPNRVAFAGKGFSGLISNPVPLPFPSAYAEYFRAMVADVAGCAPDWNLRPRLYPSEADHAKAAQLFNNFAFDKAKPVIACALTTRQARGNWPVETMLEVLSTVRGPVDCEVVFCGASSDAVRLNEIAEGLPFDVRILAGDASLLQLAAFLQRCTALLTLDSGPRHIGNAVGIPVFFARNLSHSMVEAGKYCETETDLAPPVEYLNDTEADRVARSQPVGMLADKVIEALATRG